MRRLLENETLASPATKWVSPEKREQSCEDNLAWSYGPCHACLEIEKGKKTAYNNVHWITCSQNQTKNNSIFWQRICIVFSTERICQSNNKRTNQLLSTTK